MADTLVIGGTTYNDVTGVKASDGNNTLTYIRPTGSKNISANGNNIDVTGFETVNVSVAPTLQSKSKTYTPSSSQQTDTITADAGYDGLSSVSITVNASTGTSKNFQISNSNGRVATTSYTSTGVSLTVAKTGTYNVYWSGFRSSTSGTNGSQLYIGTTAYGTAQTTFTDYRQSVKLSNVSLTLNQTITVYARARGTSYYMCVSNLTIEEV